MFFLISSTIFLTWNIQKCYQTYNAKGGDHIWPFLAIWMTKEVTFCVLNTRGECVWGVLCLGSRAKKLLLGGPPSAIYVAVPPLSLMVFFDRYILWCILRVILLQPTAEVDECVVECRRWWAVRGICPTWANSPLRTYIQYIPFYFSSLHFGPLTFPFTNVSLSLPVLKKVVDTKSALFTIGQKYF